MGGGSDEGAHRLVNAWLLPACAARNGSGVVTQPEEAAALPRPADRERPAASRHPREVGGQRATRVRGSIHRPAAALPRHLTWATRMVSRRTRSHCTKCSSATASRTASRFIPARTPAALRTACRTTCCLSSEDALLDGHLPERRAAEDWTLEVGDDPKRDRALASTVGSPATTCAPASNLSPHRRMAREAALPLDLLDTTMRTTTSRALD